MKIICTHCGYPWETNSKLMYVTCPNCQRKVNREEQEKERITKKQKKELFGGG